MPSIPTENNGQQVANAADLLLPEVNLHNIVCTAQVGCLLDLRLIANMLRNAVYTPKRFAACVIRQRRPKSTALVFSNGKMVVLGAKSLEDSLLAARMFARQIQKLGYAVKFKREEYHLQNMVGGVNFGFHVRMERLALLWRQEGRQCSWEPELFAGAIARVKCSKSVVVCLMFRTGKAVFTGAKCKEDIVAAMRELYPTIKAARLRDD